jgi:hypothetical protein
MPNFDQFERLVRQALSVHERPVTPYAAELSGVPQQERPTFARQLTRQELFGWLSRARKELVSMFPDGERFETSEDNRTGKDLVALPSGREIELKSPDGKTDANVGIKQIAWAVGDAVDDSLSQIMVGNMNKRIAIWRTMSGAQRDKAIRNSKEQQRQALLQYFSERLTVGTIVEDRLAHFAWAVSVGLTKADEVVASFNSTDYRAPLLLCADVKRGLAVYEQSFKRGEQVVVEKIASDELSSRVLVLLRGKQSRQSCTIYPHYKNSFRDSEIVIPADNWVKTPCFHIWIGR